jgi:hypothetical protein
MWAGTTARFWEHLAQKLIVHVALTPGGDVELVGQRKERMR